MKKIRIISFLAALCVLLAACAGPSEPASTEPASAGEADGTGASVSVGTLPQEPEATLPAAGGYSVQELTFTRDGKRIWGELYLPEGDGPFPAVVIGHGLDSNTSDTCVYAKIFAAYGIAAYVFDFIGGGIEIRSDGDVMEMTILTETEDMLVVLDGIRALDAVDETSVFLMGLSQGGFVATRAAARRTDDVKGLIAFYPAYGLQDDVKERTANGNHITEDTSTVNGLPVDTSEIEDGLSFNIFESMKSYAGPVLIVHGEEDDMTPIYYSERAALTFANAELVSIDGAGHGFFDEDEQYAAERAVLFILAVTGR